METIRSDRPISGRWLLSLEIEIYASSYASPSPSPSASFSFFACGCFCMSFLPYLDIPVIWQETSAFDLDPGAPKVEELLLT